jgi:hypothetical protein
MSIILLLSPKPGSKQARILNHRASSGKMIWPKTAVAMTKRLGVLGQFRLSPHMLTFLDESILLPAPILAR